MSDTPPRDDQKRPDSQDTSADASMTPPTAPQANARPGADDALQAAERMRASRERLLEQVGKVIVGQQDVVEKLMIALFARGHVLLIGVPGLAKTLLVSTVAQVLDLDFSRVQFTPDLMPSDITGTSIMQEDPVSKARSFRFMHGPIFANVVLADEINRTPPKTQAALLQAMQEQEVTAAGETYQLEAPFWVLATQNPIEQEGTYPLPEAQLDRFLFSIVVDYPTYEDEVRMVSQTTSEAVADLQQVLTGQDIIQLQQLVRAVLIDASLVQRAVSIVAASRPKGERPADVVKRYVQWGAGPRASQAIVLAAKARALLHGRVHVDFEDLEAVAPPVLRHRIVTNFHAESEGVTVDDIIHDIMRAVLKAA